MWKKERVFRSETGMYGIGQPGGIAYEATFTKAQAAFVLRQHRAGAETFEEILRMADAVSFDMAVN